MTYMIVTKRFQYDDTMFVETGKYEYVENGINGYPMIKINDEWFDLADIDAIADRYTLVRE